MAVSARCEPRFTRDVDLSLAVANDSEAERIGSLFLQRGYRTLAQVEHEQTGRFSIIRLTPPPLSDFIELPTLDLIFASCGIEPEIVRDSDPISLGESLVVPTARVEYLLAMKVLSVRERRHQDEADIQALITAALPEQIATTRQLLDLIISRGYHRNRDLHQQLTDRLKVMGREG